MFHWNSKKTKKIISSIIVVIIAIAMILGIVVPGMM